MPEMNLNGDAFSSGQISSKLWLCNEIEKIPLPTPVNIWIYGGWYGVTALLMLSREKLSIKSIRSFDIDADCEHVADAILENWVWKEWKFKSFTADCNTLNPYIGHNGHVPDLIINTSTEHFQELTWWNNIPNGMMVALQGNNMPHADHYVAHTDVESFAITYPMKETYFKGQLDFKYPTWKFSRFMTIGLKNE